MITGPPVVFVDSGGLPVTNVANGMVLTPVAVWGFPVTLVDTGGAAVTLVNEDGSLWSATPGTYVLGTMDFSDVDGSALIALMEDI